MEITPITQGDTPLVAQLAHALWPDAEPEELRSDFRRLLTSDRDLVLIVRTGEGPPVAFAHISIRLEYVEGAHPPPAGYLEGIYVTPGYRRRGIGKRLVTAGEEWAFGKGCRAFASDAELSNLESQAFHREVGFGEAGRVVCYVKTFKN